MVAMFEQVTAAPILQERAASKSTNHVKWSLPCVALLDFGFLKKF